jgi:hypothetical protein
VSKYISSDSLSLSLKVVKTNLVGTVQKGWLISESVKVMSPKLYCRTPSDENKAMATTEDEMMKQKAKAESDAKDDEKMIGQKATIKDDATKTSRKTSGKAGQDDAAKTSGKTPGKAGQDDAAKNLGKADGEAED